MEAEEGQCQVVDVCPQRRSRRSDQLNHESHELVAQFTAGKPFGCASQGGKRADRVLEPTRRVAEYSLRYLDPNNIEHLYEGVEGRGHSLRALLRRDLRPNFGKNYPQVLNEGLAELVVLAVRGRD